ncbi:hypothetical protein [Priestia megaterium]|nr:hypothetical protein [Priestia megaterium]
MIGNILAGKLLTKNAMKSAVFYPFVFGAVSTLVFLMGKFTGSMVIIILV